MEQTEKERPVVITLNWVREQKAFHKNQIREHETALADLDATERVLLRAALQATNKAVHETVNGTVGDADKQIVGIKRGLIRAIADSPTGLTTQAVIAAGHNLGWTHLNTRNVSPKLSESGKKGILRLDHGSWFITEKGREYLAQPQKQ